MFVKRSENKLKCGNSVNFFRKLAVVFLVLTMIMPNVAFAESVTTSMLSAADYEDVTEGLIAWYKLDETDSATVAKDSTDNGNDATVVGAATWNNGNGFIFSGGSASSGNAIKIPDNILTGLDDVTVTFDVLVDPNSLGNARMFSLGNTSASTGYLSATAQDGSFRFSAAFANSNTYTAQRTMWMLPTLVWKSVAVTLKGGESDNLGRLTLYEDGVVAATATNVARKPPATSTNSHIGRSQSSSHNSFKGIIRNFRIYNRELTAEDVITLAKPVVDEGLAEDNAALTLGDTSSIATDISLPSEGLNSTTITWESSDESVITSKGVITRPQAGLDNKTATLTATISRAGVTLVKEFNVTVLAEGNDIDVNWEADNLEVVNATDVRGNIDLPTEGKLGTAISWESSNPAIITSTGEVQRPAYGESSINVNLTATISKGQSSKVVTITATVKPMPRKTPDTAYAMSHFKSNNIDGEKAYLLVSNGNNALSWTAVNNGYPILESRMGTKGIRDPFIIRSVEGDKYFMLATDMSYPRFGNWSLPSRKGSRHLVVFESNDLVNWSEQRLPIVSPDNVGNSWAPEAYYDDSIGAYVVYWASKFYDNETDPEHEGTSYNRMLYAITRDFVNFSDPVLWYDEPGFNRIDIAVIKEGDTYYRFIKDDADSTSDTSPATTRDIFVDKHTNLRATPYTEWTPVSEELGRKSMGGARFGTGYEGPIIIKANEGDVNGEGYYFFADRYIGSGTGYYAAYSDDLEAQVWTSKTMSIPSGTHHGSVISITQNDVNRLKGLPIEKVATATILSQNGSQATATVTAADEGEVAGRVMFSSGTWSTIVKLNKDGIASASIPAGLQTGTTTIVANYLGNDDLLSSEDSLIFEGGSTEFSVNAMMQEKDGIATVTVNVNNAAGDVDRIIYVAAYNDEGDLLSIAEKDIPQSTPANYEFALDLDVTESNADYSVKVFIWEKDSQAPLLEPVLILSTGPLVKSNPETFCNPINISYRYQNNNDSNYQANDYRAGADPTPIYFKGEYYLFVTCSSGYWYSSDLMNWEYLYVTTLGTGNQASGTQINLYAPTAVVIGDYMYLSHSQAGNVYRTTDPKSGVWERVRTNTRWQDPYFFYDEDTERLFVVHGCSATLPIRITELNPSTFAPLSGQVLNNTTSDTGQIIFERRDLYGYEVPGQLNDNYAPHPDAQMWIEGPGMIKHNGKYYVYYSGPGTEYASYNDGCYVADDPLGPYTWCDNSPFAYKVTGFVNAVGHGHDVVERTNGNMWKFGTASISNLHMFERRISAYPIKFNEREQLVADLAFADYPMYAPTSKKSSYETPGPGWNLVSYGATATASSTYNVTRTPSYAFPFEISPDKAFDESMRTWWSATTGNVGEWIMGDMGKIKTVNALQINFADQDTTKVESDGSTKYYRDNTFRHRYIIEYSIDGSNWYTVVDRSNATAEPNKAQDLTHDYYELAGEIPMRYIRITNKGEIPAGGKFAVSGLRLFGHGRGTAPEKVENITLSRIDGRDERSVQVTWDAVPGAEGYIVRFGTHEDDLNVHHQVIGKTTEIINALARDYDYYFRIDTYNDSGITKGTKTVKIEGKK